MIINDKLYLKINQLSTDKKQFKNHYIYDDEAKYNYLEQEHDDSKTTQTKENFEKQQKCLFEYLQNQRIKFKIAKQKEEKQLVQSKRREIRIQKRLMSAGITNQTKSFVTAVPIRDQFSQQAFLQQSANQSQIQITAKSKLLSRPSLQSSKKQSFIKQRPQTTDNVVPKINRYTQLLQQNPWRPPSSVGQCFNKKNIFELDEQTKQRITEKQQILYEDYLKTAKNKIILEENLIENGQLGWKFAKTNYDAFSSYEKNIFHKDIQEKKEKLIPFKPTKSIGKLFSDQGK